MLFLKIVAGCIIAVIVVGALLLGGIYFLFRSKLRNFIKEAFENCDNGPILSIHLHENLDRDWLNNDEILPLIQELKTLGFKPGKAYTVEELNGFDLLSLFGENYGAVIHKNPLGVSVEFNHTTADDVHYTITNSTIGESEKPENMTMVIMHDADIQTMFNTMEEYSKGVSKDITTDDNFRELVERLTKEEITYKNRNGGISYEEFLSTAEAIGEKGNLTEDELRSAFIETKTEELETWNNAGIRAYNEANPISTENEESYQESMQFIVPKKTDPEALVHFLSYFDIVLDKHVDKIGKSVRKELDIYQLFERLNVARSPDRRAILKGEVTYPADARVYELAYID